MLQPPPVNRPRVLVLLATYNGARHIAEQLRSLAEQKGVRVTVLASDDGSNDGTVELTNQVALELRLPLHFLPLLPPSGSAARNFFRLIRDADFSSCDYVALSDQDDIWLEDKMCRAASVLGGVEFGGYSCNSLAFWPDGTEVAVTKNYPQRRWDYLFESASHGCTYVLTAATARRFQTFLAQNPRGADQIEFHDMLIYAWARTQGIPWRMDDQRLIRYRQFGQNVFGVNAGRGAAALRLRKLREGWLRAQALHVIHALGLEETPMGTRILRYGFTDRVVLASRARECRRRPRDAMVFCLSCLLLGSGAAPIERMGVLRGR